MRNYTEHIAKGTIVTLAAGLAATAGGYALRVFLARSLSVEEYGTFYAVISFLAFFGIFKELGLGQAIVKMLPEFIVQKKHQKIKAVLVSALLTQLVAGALITAGLFVFSGYIATNFFHNAETKIIIQIMSVEFFVGFVALRHILQGLQKIALYALVDAVRIALIFATLAVFIDRGVAGVAISYLTAAVLINAALFVYVFAKTRAYFRGKMDTGAIKPLYRFALVLFGGSLAGMVISSADTLMIAFFLSARDVALYQAAMPTSQLLAVFSTALTAVLAPSVSEIWASGRKQILGPGVALMLKSLFILMAPFAIIMLAFPEIIFNFIFGSSYIEASKIIVPLVFSAVLYSLHSVMLTVLLGAGKPVVNTKILIGISAINFALNLALIPAMGITGAATSIALTYLVAFLWSSHNVKKLVKIKLDGMGFFVVALGAGAAILAIYIVKARIVTEPVAEAVVSLTVGLAVYSAIVLKMGGVRKSDIKMLEKINVRIPSRVTKFLYGVVRE